MASCEHMTSILNLQKVMLLFQQIQTGLTDHKMTKTLVFDARVTARYIRLNPMAWEVYPSFSFELIGCSMYFFNYLIIALFSDTY